MHPKSLYVHACDKYYCVTEKNYFDQQQQQQAEVAEEAEEETEIPTVPADPRTTDERCYVCRLVSPLLFTSSNSLKCFFFLITVTYLSNFSTKIKKNGTCGTPLEWTRIPIIQFVTKTIRLDFGTFRLE